MDCFTASLCGGWSDLSLAQTEGYWVQTGRTRGYEVSLEDLSSQSVLSVTD